MRIVASRTIPQIALSDWSKELVEEGNKILVKGEFNAIKHSFYKRFSASHKELMSPRRDLVIL